jgi:hypothetical protein
MGSTYFCLCCSVTPEQNLIQCIAQNPVTLEQVSGLRFDILVLISMCTKETVSSPLAKIEVPIMTLQLLSANCCEKLKHIHSVKLFQCTDGFVKLRTLFNVRVHVMCPRPEHTQLRVSPQKTLVLETLVFTQLIEAFPTL